MCDCFDQFRFGGAVLSCVVEVEHELFGVAARGETGDGSQAAFLRGQFGARPDLSELEFPLIFGHLS